MFFQVIGSKYALGKEDPGDPRCKVGRRLRPLRSCRTRSVGASFRFRSRHLHLGPSARGSRADPGRSRIVWCSKPQCDGASNGIQLGCMFFWKERWLSRWSGWGEQPSQGSPERTFCCRENEPATYCRGTELGQAAGIAPSRWNPLEYFLLLARGSFLLGTRPHAPCRRQSQDPESFSFTPARCMGRPSGRSPGTSAW